MNKEKVKKFVKEHKEAIIVGGIASVGTVVYGLQMYKKGIIDGGMLSFHVTMNWFEEHFPDKNLNLNNLWETYKLENPDKVVYKTGLGKWEHK